MHQLQLLLPSPSCSIVFFSSFARSRYPFLFSLLHPYKLPDFYGCLNDSLSPNVSRILLNFHVNFSSAKIWIVSIFPSINSFSSLSSIFSGTGLTAPGTIHIIASFRFDNFFNSPAKTCFLASLSFTWFFTLCSAGKLKFTGWKFLLINLK